MENNKPYIEKDKLEAGYIFAPYITLNKANYINNKMVWHHNKIINFFLKIKLFFDFKNRKLVKRYSEKKIDKSRYGVVKLEKNK